MAKLKIDGGEALRDIRAGMNEIGLMKKYNLTAQGLRSLYMKLVRAGALKSSDLGPHFKVELKAKDVLSDIKQGMNGADLAEKYRLSRKGLESLLGKMLRAGLLGQAQVDALIKSQAHAARDMEYPAADFDQWAASFEETVDQGWKKKEPDFT
ncbi:MAG: hypothetical protein AB1733_03385 [Thermodesulfobacteriota bacterium]